MIEKKDEIMSMWTIYDHPSDYPLCFVARRFEVASGMSLPTADVLIAPTLGALRKILPPKFSACLHRDPHDDPAIVESWM